MDKECIGVCEECRKIFENNEFDQDGELIKDSKWGHICKDKTSKSEEHRCESYIKKYCVV